MNKNTARGIFVVAIALAVFSVVAFVIPFARTATFWVGYGFAAFAILFQLYIFKIAFVDGGDAKSKFYGFPIARVGVCFLVAQLVAGVVEMALAALLPAWVAVLVNIVILALALVGCVTVDAMRDEINRQDAQLKKSVGSMRELQSLSRALVAQCPDGELKVALEKLADDFRYSDPVSSDKTSELEADMRSQLADIQQALVDGDADAAKKLCAKLTGSLAERNRVCSMSK